MLCKSTISKVPVLNNSCSLLLFLSSEVMLKLLTLVFSVLFALVSQAHDFYFAFAEVAYDEITERLQVTVIVTTHDLEKSLLANGNEVHVSAANTSDSSVVRLIERQLNKGLFFVSGNEYRCPNLALPCVFQDNRQRQCRNWFWQSFSNLHLNKFLHSNC